MHKIALFLVSALIPFLSPAQIPNSGFEDWTSMITYNNPNEWSTLNGVTASANTFTCVKGTPGNPGNSYIKLTSKNVAGMGVKPGIAVSGKLNTSTLKAESGFPFTGRPEALTGNWQYMAYGADKGYISVLLSHWNNSTHSRDTVCYKLFALGGMVMSWAGFTIPLSYQAESFPDSALIVLSASNANGATTAANSFLYVDKLAFKNTIWLSTDDNAQQNVKMYPNPVSEILTIELPGENKPIDCEVYNSDGRRVINERTFQQSGNIKLDFSDLLPGTYFLKLLSGKEIMTRKFIKN